MLCWGAACGGGAREGTVQLACLALARFPMNSCVRLGVSPTMATTVVHSQPWVLVSRSASPALAVRCLPGCSYQSGWFFSLIFWLSEFHAVWFSGAFGCLLILDWLLSSFWLCKEMKGIYLHLHLGWNCIFLFLNEVLKFNCIAREY